MTDPSVPANTRLRLSQRERVDELVEDGEFDSRTAAVRKAVDDLLEEYEETETDT